MNIGAELIQRGEMIVALMVDTLAAAQRNAPRTQQSKARVLGLSEIGGCREYIRASISGERKDPEPFKWSALVGTIVGDGVEQIMARDTEATTQEVVTVHLPRTGITASGHLDLRWSTTGDLVDLKTKDEAGLAEVRREGPSYKNQVQVACYFKALVDEGKMDESGYAHLVYLDRSGNDENPYVWTINWERCLLLIDSLEDRLQDVAKALARGDYYASRDEPTSWCKAVGCPFQWRCWEGYEPTNEIEHPKELAAVAEFVQARDDAEQANLLRLAKRASLEGIRGITPDGWVVNWSITETPSGGESARLTVTKSKNPKPADSEATS